MKNWCSCTWLYSSSTSHQTTYCSVLKKVAAEVKLNIYICKVKTMTFFKVAHTWIHKCWFYAVLWLLSIKWIGLILMKENRKIRSTTTCLFKIDILIIYATICVCASLKKQVQIHWTSTKRSSAITEKGKLSHEEGDIFNVTLQLSQQEEEGLLSLSSYFASHV